MEFDYVVVGAGSSGCALARRLAEQSNVRVALVEAGRQTRNWSIRMPAAVSINIKRARYNWQDYSEPQEFLNNRRVYFPRGRVVGGSSAINGMIYIRGHAYDFNGWADSGAAGWAWQDVLPYFRLIEDFDGGADAWRGAGGAVPVTRGKLDDPLHEAFLQAGEQAGHGITEDVNGYRQAGVGRFDKNIKHGERWSAWRAFIDNAPEDVKARIITVPNTIVNKIIFEKTRAAGIDVLQGSVSRTIRANKEVVLCAGAFGSPSILMRSGIGPAEDLSRIGVSTLQDLAPVGANLQDHTEVHVQYYCKEPITLYRELRPLRRTMAGAKWFLNKSGQAATNHYDTGAFLSTEASVSHPDVQFHFVPIIYNNSVERQVTAHGFRVHAGPLRPYSRGFVTLRDADPLRAPVVQPAFMSDRRDWRDMERIVELSRDVFSQQAFSKYRGAELSPGSASKSATELESYFRDWVDTGYHPSGTCRMGVGKDSVVDPQGRVHGIEDLRICDASIMPRIVSGNLNATSMMMGARMADLMVGKGLPQQCAPVWETDQALGTTSPSTA